MNASNPYESPSSESESTSWTLIDYMAAGIWLAVPVSIAVARRPLTHVFEDFGVELPATTQYLLNFNSPLVLAIPAVALLLAMFAIPPGNTRRQFVRFALVSGLLAGAFCVLSILGPLYSLWQNLN